jgi:hypothetical protein
MRKTLCRGLWLAAALMALLWVAPVDGGDGGKTPPDPLLELNGDFRAAYAQARQELLAKTGPVLVVLGDDLALLRGGKRTQVRAVPEIYHTLKAVAHVPLAIYVLLAPHGEGVLPEKHLALLRSYLERLDAVIKSVKVRTLPEDVKERQLQILLSSRKFLDRVVADRMVKGATLADFARAQAPLVLANAADAARAQIDNVHKRVQAWRQEMTPAEWKALRVLVMGPPLPRKGNVMTQYFARVLGEKGEGDRILYTESVFEESRALTVLGTQLLDTQIGAAFFGDDRRMHRDLLGDAAEAYLKEIKLTP